MQKSSSEIESAAQKIVGDDAKVPKVDPFVQKPSSDRATAGKKFTADVDGVESSLSDYANSCSALGNGIERYINQIEKEEFGLDKKNKDDLKKIVAARKLLVTYYTEAKKEIDGDAKELDKLDKSLAAFSKFKPSTFW